MNLEGRLLSNRYEIIEKIGNGGMATVYKAKCHVLNRYVAIKVLKDEFTTDAEFIKRFNIEAQAVASFSHPNIVSVYDVGHDGNLYYIVMELVKGKTLKEIIIEEGKIAWKWAVKIAIQIASALETAHRNNIIHRDIKPHNIIITEDGVAKVTDFGIAKAVSNSTITAFGATIGSVHYFSPEHARGGYTDAKSDLYSLGIVMYEMVTGRVPFDADTAVSVALKHMQEEAIEPIKLNPEIPESVNKIITKAMKKDADERYQNATEMIVDLNIALKGSNASFTNTTEIPRSVSGKRANNNTKKGRFSKIKDYLEEHKGMKALVLMLIAVLVFTLAMGGTYLFLTLGKVKEVQIPNLANLTIEEAEAKAKELNIKIQVSEEKYHLEIEEGKIISQEPPYQSNYKIKEGSTVKVVVSKGQEIVEVPKFVGKTKEEAKDLAKEVGLEVEFEEVSSDEVEKNYIIEQDKKEKEEIPAGTTIKLKVSTGIEQVEVPDLSGKTEEEAKTAISNAKLKYKATLKITDSSKPNGVVVNQDISYGSLVDKNTEITITINEFDEIKSGTLNINVASLIGYTPKYKEVTDEETGETKQELVPASSAKLKVLVNDEKVEEKSVSEDTTNLPIKIEGKGTVTVKVYLNDIKKAEKNYTFGSSGTLTID